MKIIKIDDGFEIKNTIYDKENFFGIGYSEELENFIMYVYVTSWVAGYYRFYKISEDDYNLYKKAKSLFYAKYKREIGQDNIRCFTENFIGSPFPRDYDGTHYFERFDAPKNKFSFEYYAYIDGILYAQIDWKIGKFFVPPLQKIYTLDKKWSFPLREKCELLCDKSGNPICYFLKNEK